MTYVIFNLLSLCGNPLLKRNCCIARAGRFFILFKFPSRISYFWESFYRLTYSKVLEGERMKARYRVHRFDIDMTKDQSKLEQFLNNLEGEVVAIIPSVNPKFTAGGMGAKVNFLLIVEKCKQD
jgi:hypothetical protein